MFCRKPCEIPETKHYAILVFSEEEIDYDTEIVTYYHAFTDKEEWEREILKWLQSKGMDEICCFIANPCKVKIITSIEVEE